MRTAFIVIVEHPDSHDQTPVIGDIQWALLDKQQGSPWGVGWDIHTTELTAEMLERHRLPPDMPVSELRHRLAVPVDSICHLLGAFVETGVIEDEDIAHLDAIHGWLGGAS